MKKLLNKIKDTLTKKKIKDFEIYIERCGGSTVEVKEGKLEALEKDDSFGFGLRVQLKKGSHTHMGFSYGTAFDQQTIDTVVEQATASAESTSPDSHYGWTSGTQKYTAINNFDSTLSGLSKEEKTQMALQMESAAFNYDKRIKRVRYATYEDTLEEALLYNSSGLKASHQRSHVSLNLMALAEEGDESEVAFDTIFSPFKKDLNPETVAVSASKMAVELLGGKKIPNFKGPIILHPAVAVEMLEILAPSTLSENIHKKNSFLVGKLEKKIYSSKITLIDDGLLPVGVETSPFDAEGTPRQTTPVIEKGVVKNFLYDSYWGKKEGVPSTGNLLRESPVDIPELDLTNFYVKKGEISQEEMIQKIDRGIFVTEVIGMHTADPISGDFSVGIQGFLIEKGQKKKAIRSVALSGNLHDLFSKVIEAGSDLKFYSNFGSPSLLIEEASVSGD